MTVRAKATFVLAFFAFANLAVWGGKEILGALYDPILRSLGA